MQRITTEPTAMFVAYQRDIQNVGTLADLSAIMKRITESYESGYVSEAQRKMLKNDLRGRQQSLFKERFTRKIRPC